MLKALFDLRVFRFILGGGIATAFNLLLMFILVELCGFDTFVLRNLANAISIELSLIFSFFIYRTWVWPDSMTTGYEVLWRQIPLYHLSAGAAVASRLVVVFPTLDWFGVHYAVNTLAGIALGASINYVISDRVVFKPRAQSA